jgi:predicted TIM-barrel fold metal-dependent hydrolase
LKLVASIQPAHQLEDVGVVERVWPGAKGRTYPMLDLLRAGARLAFGSDAPVASLDPWKAIEAACHRPYRADQALTPLTALRASTRTTLGVGQPADLVLTAGPGKVLLTMLGGRVTFSR